MRKIALLGFLFFSISMVAQTNSNNTPFNFFQDSILHLFKRMKISNTDVDKEKYNQELLTTFETALNTPNSFDFPYDSLKLYMAILLSPDKKFRIINWNLPRQDGTHEYYGFIQEKYLQVTKKGLFRKERTETMQLYPLIDKSLEIKNPDNAITDNKKWFGMLYYKIILKKTKSKTYYTLLGWDGNDVYTQKKIIDVLTFDNNGTPRFGADIFNMQKKYPKRVIFEYSASCKITVRYSSKKDSIVFDHLAPTSPQLVGQYQYYCTDESFDGFGFKKGKWNYGIDVNAINEKDEKDKLYIDPRKEVRTKESNTYIEKGKVKKPK